MRAPMESDLRDGLLQADSGLQFGEGTEPVEVAGHVLGFKNQGPPDLRKCPVEGATCRQDSDHGMRAAVEGDGPADHLRVGGELRVPECVTEDGDIVLPRLILVGRKGAAECCLDAENVEIVRRDA